MARIDWQLRTLFTSSASVVVVRVVGIILQSAIIVYLARTLSLVEMGYFAIVSTVLTLARMLGPLGSDQIAMRDISSALSRGALNEAQALSGRSLALVLTANAALSVICLVTLLFVRNATALTTVDCLTISLALPSFALNGLFAGQIRGMGKVIAAQVPDSIGLQIVFMAGLAGLLTFGEVNLSSVLLFLCLSSWFVSGAYFVIRRRTGIYASTFPGWQEIWSLAREGGSIFQALLFTGLSVRAPLLLSAPLLGPAATAVLEIATRFGTLPSIITNSVSSTFSPRFAVLAERNDSRGLQKALYLAALLSAVPAAFMMIVLAIVVPPLFGWFLPVAYEQAYIPLLIITAASTFNGALGISASVLIMAGLPDPVRFFSLVRLVGVTVLCISLGTTYGVVGMAWAVLLATLLRDAGLALVAHRKLLSSDERQVAQ